MCAWDVTCLHLLVFFHSSLKAWLQLDGKRAVLTQLCVTASQICSKIPNQQISGQLRSMRQMCQAIGTCCSMCPLSRSHSSLCFSPASLSVALWGGTECDVFSCKLVCWSFRCAEVKDFFSQVFFLTFSKWTEYEYLAVLYRLHLKCFLASSPECVQCLFWQRSSISKTQ